MWLVPITCPLALVITTIFLAPVSCLASDMISPFYLEVRVCPTFIGQSETIDPAYARSILDFRSSLGANDKRATVKRGPGGEVLRTGINASRPRDAVPTKRLALFDCAARNKKWHCILL
jgi:hypothetical protein